MWTLAIPRVLEPLSRLSRFAGRKGKRYGEEM
jgi:hypothetical protein